MRRIGWKNNDQSQGMDWEGGPQWPPQGSIAACSDKNGWVVYEVGDEDLVPEAARPSIKVLGDVCSDDQVLWRYIDISKLYMLLLHSELHFTPAMRLRQDEGYEFRIPLPDRAAGRAALEAMLEQRSPGDPGNVRELQYFDSEPDPHLDLSAVSCWHMNTRENNAFWASYVPNGGVAIKTTLGRIKRAFAARWRENFHPARDILGAKVQYINYETDTLRSIDQSIGFEVMFHKADFFAFEQEFRFVLMLARNTEAERQQACRVPVDIPTLVEEIVLGPRPKYMTDFIVRDMARRAGLDPSIVRASRVGGDVVRTLYGR